MAYNYLKKKKTNKQKLISAWLLQIFESDKLLVESTDSQSGTVSTLDSYPKTELVHGTVCDIYTCYTLYEHPPLTELRTTPVTCTVVGKQDHG